MLVKCALLSALALGCIATAADPAPAQSYPTRPITIVVPFAPGGTDAFLRSITDRLSASLGKPVIIENRPGGAGGTVGTKAVANANPDGYTLLAGSPGPLVVASAVYKNLGYDPVKSFTPVATLYTSPHMLVVNPSLRVYSLRELVGYAKARPAAINYASPGYGTLPHLLGEMLRLNSEIDIVHVAYKGPSPAITDLLAGQVQIYFEYLANLRPHIESGNMRAIANADKTRSPHLPDVPTTIESGFPQIQSRYWNGILAPAGTPSDIVSRLNAVFNEALKSREIEEVFAKLGADANISSPQEFADFIAAETRKWAAVADAAGIRAN